MPSAKGGMSKMERDWQAEDDLRTLVRAREIQNDKERLKRARALAQKQMKELEATTKG